MEKKVISAIFKLFIGKVHDGKKIERKKTQIFIIKII